MNCFIMKSVICGVLLIVAFATFAKGNEDNDNWPCYLKKCGRNDPNLSTCLLNHANRALSFIFDGDDKIGIPRYIAYTSKNLFFGKNKTLKVYLNDSKVFGLQNIYVVNINWNFAAKTLDIDLRYNNAIYINSKYVASGTFFNRSTRGKGRVDFIFVGGSQGANLTYNMNYDLIKILGREYVQIKNRVCTRSEGIRIDFTNELISKTEAEAHRHEWNRYSKEANAAFTSDIKELICELVDKALNPIFYNFPFDLIFDSD